jgi:membrane protease YdiL (CAAX protease family)
MFSNTLEGWTDGIFLAVCAISLIVWARLARTRMRARLPLLEPQDRQLPFWTLAEFFVCFGMFVICIAASQKVGRDWMSPETVAMLDAGTFEPSKQTPQDMMVMIIASSIASFLAMTSVLVWMNLITPTLLKRYGLWLSLEDVKLGSKAALLILPPVLLLSTLIDYFIKYEHPVLDTLKAEPSLNSMLLLAFTTVVLTPIFEEFTFRVLLQGGAEQVARRVAITGSAEKAPEPLQLDRIAASEVATWSWWPVVMASGTFAALHLGQGAAPVPLFFLSLALGYLYRQTGRMGPGLVVHAILNGLTITLSTLKIVLE